MKDLSRYLVEYMQHEWLSEDREDDGYSYGELWEDYILDALEAWEGGAR